MILVDSGALYAAADQRDKHHAAAIEFVRRLPVRESLAISMLVVTETATLLECRLGALAGRAFWSDVTRGAFTLLPTDETLLGEALEIDSKYADIDMGMVDCASLALCERHRLHEVFTFDRKHFGLYRPTFTRRLKLLP